MQIKELVEKIVRALVDSPEEVDVQVIGGISINLVKIRVSKKDIGAVLGKKGKNISALEAIVLAAGKGKRCIIDVVDYQKDY